MILPTSVNWTSLNTLRVTPGSGTLILPASLLAIINAVNLKPAVVRPALEDLVKQGYVREFQTRYGKAYARTPKGEQRILEVRQWLR